MSHRERPTKCCAHSLKPPFWFRRCANMSSPRHSAGAESRIRDGSSLIDVYVSSSRLLSLVFGLLSSNSPRTAGAKRQAVRSGYLGDHQNPSILRISKNTCVSSQRICSKTPEIEWLSYRGRNFRSSVRSTMRLPIDTGTVMFAAAATAEPVLEYETRAMP